LFDACPAPSDHSKHRLTDALHHWFLRKLYPRPGLVIFLDAPAEVLYARKQEVPMEYLQREREKILQKRSYANTFVTVDSTQPVAEVIDEVMELVLIHCGRS
jgi:thymidylate kinase